MFGDRALRIHLEVLATLDRNENRWRLSGHWLAGLSRKVCQQPATVQRVIGWMLEKCWLIAEERATDGSPTILSARNYWMYHKMREPSGAKIGTEKEHKRGLYRAPPYPNLPYPNLREERRVPVETVNCGDKGKSVDTGDERIRSGTDDPMSHVRHSFDLLSNPSTREIFERNMLEAEEQK